MITLQVPVGNIFTFWEILIFIGIVLVTINFGTLILYVFKKRPVLKRVLFISGIFMFLVAFVFIQMEDKTAEFIAYLIITLGLLGISVPLLLKPKEINLE